MTQKSLVDSALPSFACRAWVYFDATSGTPVILGSGNIASITYNGVGDFTLNFTTPMTDANYAAVITTDAGGSGAVRNAQTTSATASAYRFMTKNLVVIGTNTLENQPYTRVAIFR